MTNCKDCSIELTSRYCPGCGRPNQLKRIDAHYISHEIEHVLHFDRGMLYTIRELLTRPGISVKRFISEDRSRLVKPIIFIIITSLIYTITSHFFHIQSVTSYGFPEKSSITKIYQWTENNMGYSNIIMGAMIAGWIKLFFRKYPYNYFEIIILLCFAMGVGMLFFALFALLEGITHSDFKTIAAVLGIGYCTWAIGQFFDAKKGSNYVKALLAYLAGMITYSVLAIVIGILVDVLFGK